MSKNLVGTGLLGVHNLLPLIGIGLIIGKKFVGTSPSVPIRSGGPVFASFTYTKQCNET